LVIFDGSRASYKRSFAPSSFTATFSQIVSAWDVDADFLIGSPANRINDNSLQALWELFKNAKNFGFVRAVLFAVVAVLISNV